MRLSSLTFLLRATIRGRCLRNIAVVGGLAVGMLALGISTIAGLGSTRALQRHLLALFPEQLVILEPKTVEALLFKATTMDITVETVAAVKDLPGVVRVCPEAYIRFPISGRGSLMGQEYSSDMTVLGVDAWLLGEEAPPGFTYTEGQNVVVPAVLSGYFLDLYNVALAESNNLPKFSGAAIKGQRLDLVLGESTLQAPDPQRRTRRIPADIQGLCSNPDLLGLILPLDAVEAFNEWYGIKDRRYRQLHVELVSAEAVEDLKPHLDALGLQMKDRMATWRKALVVVRLVAAALVAFGILVFALAIAYLTSTITWMLSERRRELALFRALGASPRQVTAILASEIGVISLTGILIGLTAAVAALHGADALYLQWRSGRPFLPETLFAFPLAGIALLGLVSWGTAMAFALAQVMLSTRAPISGALAKNE